MADTFVKIATVTVGSGGAANITFSSIPSTYTDIQLFLSARSTGGTTQDYAAVQFNASGGTAYSDKRLEGTGSSASVASDSSQNVIYSAYVATGSTATSSIFGNTSFYIPNYSGATNKSVSIDGVTENNGTVAYQTLTAALWANTSAITQVVFTLGNGNFAQYSTATLYGISKS
jgi:hypothetical protein